MCKLALWLCSGIALASRSGPKWAVRLGQQFGAVYLPAMIMESQQLVEKHLAAAGMGDVKVGWDDNVGFRHHGRPHNRRHFYLARVAPSREPQGIRGGHAGIRGAVPVCSSPKRTSFRGAER
jgi:hypothetical protein